MILLQHPYFASSEKLTIRCDGRIDRPRKSPNPLGLRTAFRMRLQAFSSLDSSHCYPSSICAKTSAVDHFAVFVEVQ
jgi:hypothetical protein